MVLKILATLLFLVADGPWEHLGKKKCKSGQINVKQD
jgi:hypothetical protein